MNSFQKVIKYVAIAFAILLSISIIKFGLDIVYLVLQSTNLVQSNSKVSNVNFNELSSYLDIDVSYANLEIKRGETLRYETNVDGLESTQENNKLTIKENNKNIFKNKNKYVTLYVPENLNFDKVVINMGVGKLDIRDVNLNNVDLDLGIGKVYVESTLTGKNSIECGIGEVNLNLNLTEEDYTFKLDKGIGSINLNNNNIGDSITIGSGNNVIDVEGGIGSIIIKTR